MSTYFTQSSLIETLITSKTRLKLLLKFFLNPANSAYLRGLEAEFGESSNAIRLELNRLENAHMLDSRNQGNKKLYTVNKQHPLFSEINSIVRKFYGIDVIIEQVAEKLGNVHKVYLTGDIAEGISSQVLDIVFVGDIDMAYLQRLCGKVEKLIHRKIRYLVLNESEFKHMKLSKNALLLWNGK